MLGWHAFWDEEGIEDVTHAEQILKRIKTVDLEDRSELRELAAALEAWLDTYVPDWRGRMPEHCYKLQPAGYPLAYILFFSRDALKAIRPERWKTQISQNKDGWYVKLCREVFITTPYGRNRLPTEELAELYAIIKAYDTPPERSEAAFCRPQHQNGGI